MKPKAPLQSRGVGQMADRMKADNAGMVPDRPGLGGSVPQMVFAHGKARGPGECCRRKGWRCGATIDRRDRARYVPKTGLLQPPTGAAVDAGLKIRRFACQSLVCCDRLLASELLGRWIAHRRLQIARQAVNRLASGAMLKAGIGNREAEHCGQGGTLSSGCHHAGGCQRGHRHQPGWLRPGRARAAAGRRRHRGRGQQRWHWRRERGGGQPRPGRRPVYGWGRHRGFRTPARGVRRPSLHVHRKRGKLSG